MYDKTAQQGVRTKRRRRKKIQITQIRKEMKTTCLFLLKRSCRILQKVKFLTTTKEKEIIIIKLLLQLF